MIPKKFSKNWKRSIQPRQQRKYTLRAPLHIKQKAVHVHLSPALRTKYGFRNIGVRKGDKVRVLRGKFTKKEGKVDRVLLKKSTIFITGVEYIKRDGSKILVPINPSNLMIIELELGDTQRREKLESKTNPKTTSPSLKESKNQKIKKIKETTT